MPTIKVQVQDKIALNLTPEVKIVCRNSDYEVEFKFDEIWGALNFKTGIFVYNGKIVEQPFDGNICPVPILDNTTLVAIGVKTSESELYTSTPAYADCLYSFETNTPAPTKEVYDEIIALLNKYISGGGAGVDLKDYQKKIDNNLETESKTIVEAINEVNEKAGQGGSGVEFGETEGTAYEGDKGAQNAKNIAKLQSEVEQKANTEYVDSAAAALSEQIETRQTKADETLETESKEIVGAINEVNARTDENAQSLTGVLEQAKTYTDEELAKFDFIKIVSALPETGLPNRIYLVPQENGASPDFFVEYLWVNKGTEEEPVWVWEYVSTKTVEIDLTEYVKKDQYASSTEAGVVKLASYKGFGINNDGLLAFVPATDTEIQNQSAVNHTLVPYQISKIVKTGITTNTETLTDEEKAAAQDWLGITALITGALEADY